MKKQMNKAQMVKELKLMEAIKWDTYKEQERLSTLLCGTDDQEKWSSVHKEMMRTYAREWLVIHDVLKALEIQPFTWGEREKLRNNKNQ